MISDMEKVANGLRHCLPDECTLECPYINDSDCTRSLMQDTLALLKEHEPAKPRIDEENDYHCGSCDAIVGWEEITCAGLTPYVYNHCPVCGQAVKWE